MFDLREQPSLRIGVIISDERTIVYALASRKVEAGSTSAERPNAIFLGGPATETLAVASGTTPPPEAHQPNNETDQQADQEIGHKTLQPTRVEKMGADLEADSPRPFDLTRRLTVFVSEV